MAAQEPGSERFPMIPPQPQPWFELVLRYLDEEQQRIIMARVMDMYILQQEQMLDVARMARAMLKREHQIDV